MSGNIKQALVNVSPLLGNRNRHSDQQQKTEDKCFRKTVEGLEPNFYLSHVREKHIPTLNEPEET